MKKQFLSFPLIIVIFILSGCMKDKCTSSRTFSVFHPVYMTYEEFRAIPIASEAPQPLDSTGKIYLKDNFIFINEINKGVHVIDNSNPHAPQNIAFINIPGNKDIAARGNYLYADSHMDLLTIDISNPAGAQLVNRKEFIFPQHYPQNASELDTTKGVVIKWEEEVIKENIDCNSGNIWFPRRGIIQTRSGNMPVMFSAEMTASPSPGIYKGGSMARFAIIDQFLYVLDNYRMNLYNIANPSDPVYANKVSISSDIETIFPYEDKIFIGSQSGMIIYDNSDPANPVYLTRFNHVTSCDPVVVEGDMAYITLRSGTFCDGFTNQLDVVDIKDIYKPRLLKTYEMHNPHGLGIDDGVLFICDEKDGLKIYDASQPDKIDKNMLKHFKDVNAYDVIPHDKKLLMIGDGKFYQYDYSNIKDIKLISTIH